MALTAWLGINHSFGRLTGLRARGAHRVPYWPPCVRRSSGTLLASVREALIGYRLDGAEVPGCREPRSEECARQTTYLERASWRPQPGGFHNCLLRRFVLIYRVVEEG